MLLETLTAYQKRDPAARSKLEIFLLYAGVHAIRVGQRTGIHNIRIGTGREQDAKLFLKLVLGNRGPVDVDAGHLFHLLHAGDLVDIAHDGAAIVDPDIQLCAVFGNGQGELFGLLGMPPSSPVSLVSPETVLLPEAVLLSPLPPQPAKAATNRLALRIKANTFFSFMMLLLSGVVFTSML